MVVLYHSGGASDFELDGEPLSGDPWQPVRSNVLRVLLSRGNEEALNLLTSIPFEVSEASNHFGDEFSVLHATQPLVRYEELRAMQADSKNLLPFRDLANTVSEVGGPYIRFIAVFMELADTAPVPEPVPRITTDVVERALADAESLLRQRGPTSAVDRAHTALHGYLAALCDEHRISYPARATLTELFKKLRAHHPAIPRAGSNAGETNRVLRNLSSIIDTLNHWRNNATLAHANDELLDASDAMLALNCVRTIIAYLDGKLAQ